MEKSKIAKKKKRMSRFRTMLIFVWMIAGVLTIWILIEGLRIIMTVKKYFP